MEIIRKYNLNVIDLLGYGNENQNYQNNLFLNQEKEEQQTQTQEYYNQLGYQLEKLRKLIRRSFNC